MAHPKKKATVDKLKIAFEAVIAIAALVAIPTSIYVLIQNSQTIKASNQAFQLSLVPSLNIEYPTISKPKSFTLQNTSSVTITNVEIYSACYMFTTDDKRQMVNRHQSSSILRVPIKTLASGEEAEISAVDFIDACPIPEVTDTGSNRFFSLILVFHREIDNKRFIKIEPFGGGLENGIPIAVPIYATPRSGSGGGNPQGLLESLRKIEETEKTLFRAEQ